MSYNIILFGLFPTESENNITFLFISKYNDTQCDPP